ncbi:BAG domain-containing protein Samui [Culicoides brevitarsis]|uniref:BAG domain-containing protein Samui n=1 Tax=Culicoides brevitarsis TaxID=469753 RepID=UPI00307C1816
MPQNNQQQGQAQPQAQQQQPNVRMIPIFVEGRDQPVIPRDIPDSSSSGSIPEMGQVPQYPPGRQEMPRMSPNMSDFANDMPGFSHGSIFDRAKDFPVRRSFPTAQEFFNRGASPSRESPIRQVPINHVNEPAFSPFGANSHQQFMPSRRQQPSPPTQQMPFPPNKQPRSRTSSRNSEEPAGQQQEFEQQARQVPIQRQSPAPQQQQQQQQQRAPSEEPKPKPMPEGPIEKIQKIQKNVLDLMTQVEQFNGKTKKDKEYIYLDEMLTQNLLRLDDVETGGKENVKLARKEAVKCINRCLSVLEAKAEAAEHPSDAAPMETNVTQNGEIAPENTQNENQQMEVDPSNNQEQAAPEKQASRGSIYDNHDPNAPATQQNSEQPASQKEGTPQPTNEKRESKENSPAVQQQQQQKEPTPPVAEAAVAKSGSGSSQK